MNPSTISNIKRRICMHFVGIGAFFVLFAAPAAAADFSHWDALLKKYVQPVTIAGVKLSGVQYENLKQDPGYQKALDALANASLSDLKTREEKLSFWINAYNILAVKVVADNYPVKSIKDAGSLFKSVWKQPAGEAAGEIRTLNDVEHEILRKMDEPRIHLAIVCASVSCPDLRNEAYTPDKLNEQLEEQTRLFLQNAEKGMKIDAKKGKVYLSSIFKWFKGDFEPNGGVVPFVAQYASPADQKVLGNGKIKVAYLDYNWDLNEGT